MIRDILKYTLLALALLFAGCEEDDNVTANSWIRRSWASFPMNYSDNALTVVCNNKAYLFSNFRNYVDIASYDPVSDTWEREGAVPFLAHWGLHVGFSIGDIIYMGGGDNLTGFWSFDTTWE